MAHGSVTPTISIPLVRILKEVPACEDPFFTDSQLAIFGAQEAWISWVVWPARQVIDLSVTLGGNVLTASVDFVEDRAGMAVRRLGLCPRVSCANPRAVAVILVNEHGWGCRRCMSVPFDSRLPLPMDRAIKGAQRAMVLLGADDPRAFLRPPAKPRGMSWARFWKLRGELERHVSVWWDLFCRDADETTIEALTVLTEEEHDGPTDGNPSRGGRAVERDTDDLFERVILDRRRDGGGGAGRGVRPHPRYED